MHFHGAGLLSLAGVIDDSNGSGVVNVYWCWRLWMAKFIQGYAQDFGLLGIEKQGTQFGLGGRCGNELEDGASNVNRAVKFDWITIDWDAIKEEVSTGSTGVYVENHVGCLVSNLGIGMCQHVVKELVNPFLGVNSRGRLLRGNVR